MKVRVCLLVVISFIVTYCGRSGSNNSEIRVSLNQRIILVNIADANRADIARALSTISSCKPKIIGITAVFNTDSLNNEDALLSKAIQQAGNVMLPMSLEDGEIICSAPVFANASKAQGLLDYGYTDEQVTKHKLYFSNADSVIWGYPTVIASYYDMFNADKIMKSGLTSEYCKITYRWHEKDFRVLDLQDLETGCEELNDKIVLMGDLGPNEQDVFDTPSGPMHGTTIVANFVENLLAGSFEEID